MTPYTPSVLHRLRVGFVWMALVGMLVLAAFLIVDFELMKREARASLGSVGILHEVVDHVIFPLAVLLVPLLIATRWVIRRSLDPLIVAAARINRVAGQERGFRVDAAGVPLEALPFVEAVNQLLARLDDAARRQEGFAADVAHELKTPLAVVMLELQRIDNDDARRALADLAAMNRLIEQLLVLAQLDAYAAAPQPFHPLDQRELALDAIKLTARLALADDVRLSLREEAPEPIVGRAEAIGAALRNLVENAIRVTPAGGEVALVCGPGRTMRVIDGGPGIAADRLAQLCNRFNRAEHASAGGAGLGLSITARIMAVHGGRVDTDAEEPSIKLIFPEAPRP